MKLNSSETLNNFSGYRNQFERLFRSYNKLERIDKSWIPYDFNLYLDDIYWFFMNCYHLKDWLINDKKFPAQRDEVESYINSNEELKICADICNSQKHLKLNKSRSNKQPRVGKAETELTINSMGLQMKTNFIIETSMGPLGAFELATKCKKLWEDFILEYEKKIIS